MVWYGMVWYGMVWYGMVWYGMVWYGMVWYGMVWYGMVWYGILWYGTVPTYHPHQENESLFDKIKIQWCGNEINTTIFLCMVQIQL
jgi:hypothetical protein